ncbi:tetratricopeptide repeat protein [Cystobacter fuscus]
MSSFEQAKKERPNDPAVDFNRGDALMKLGRYDEAKQAFQGVAEANGRPDLRQKATYNLGNVHAALGDTREAMKAYRRALTMDPTDAQARHNYEVLLRNLPPPRRAGVMVARMVARMAGRTGDRMAAVPTRASPMVAPMEARTAGAMAAPTRGRTAARMEVRMGARAIPARRTRVRETRARAMAVPRMGARTVASPGMAARGAMVASKATAASRRKPRSRTRVLRGRSTSWMVG